MIFKTIIRSIFSIILLSSFFINISFAELWDIFYVKTDTLIVYTASSEYSEKITTLRKWYIVSDLWVDENGFRKVELTDGKIWFLDINNIWLNNSNPYKINWKYWKVNIESIYLKKLPSVDSSNVSSLSFKDKLSFLHINLINDRFVKVLVFSWKSIWKVGYLGVEYIDIYTWDENFLDNEIGNTFNPTSISNSQIIKNIRYLKENNPEEYLKYEGRLLDLKEGNLEEYNEAIEFYRRNAPDLLPYWELYLSWESVEYEAVEIIEEVPLVSYEAVEIIEEVPLISYEVVEEIRYLKENDFDWYMNYRENLLELKYTDLDKYKSIIKFYIMNAPDLVINEERGISMEDLDLSTLEIENIRLYALEDNHVDFLKLSLIYDWILIEEGNIIMFDEYDTWKNNIIALDDIGIEYIYINNLNIVHIDLDSLDSNNFLNNDVNPYTSYEPVPIPVSEDITTEDNLPDYEDFDIEALLEFME